MDIQAKSAPRFEAPPVQIEKPRARKKIKFIVVATVLMVLLVVLGYLFFRKPQSSKAEWQAVFLQDGQIYFGKVVSEKSDPVILREIYYLQEIQPLQQVDPGEKPAGLAATQLAIVKLGSELHGPQDEMRINREQILFVEDLRDDGRVVSAIREYQAKEAK